MTAGRVIRRGAADSLVLEAAGAKGVGIERVAAVDEQRVPHPLHRGRPVEIDELGPLGHEDRRIRVVERLEGGRGHVDSVEVVGPVRHRIPRAHVRALGDQPTGEDETRRLAHVVGTGLEGEPEERDLLAAERAQPPLELSDDAALLELVDLDDRVQELEVVARVRG